MWLVQGKGGGSPSNKDKAAGILLGPGWGLKGRGLSPSISLSRRRRMDGDNITWAKGRLSQRGLRGVGLQKKDEKHNSEREATGSREELPHSSGVGDPGGLTGFELQGVTMLPSACIR